MNPIVTSIALWLAETTAACFIEAFIAAIINIWNRCVAEYNLPLWSIDVQKLYSVSNYANASTSYELRDFTGDVVCGDLIMLDEIEDQESENTKYTSTETCGDVLVYEPVDGLLDFQPHNPFDVYDIYETEFNESERIYESMETLESLYLQPKGSSQDNFQDFKIGLFDDAWMKFEIQNNESVEESQDICELSEDKLSQEIIADVFEPRETEFHFECDSADEQDFDYHSINSSNSVCIQTKQESSMGIHSGEIMVHINKQQDSNMLLSKPNTYNAVQRNDHLCEELPAIFSELQFNQPEEANKITPCLPNVNGQASKDEKIFESCDIRFFEENIHERENRQLPDANRKMYSIRKTEEKVNRKRNAVDDKVACAATTSEAKQIMQDNQSKRVRFNKDIQTFTFEPSLSITENFNLEEEFVVEDLDVDDKSNFMLMDDSDFDGPSTSTYFNGNQSLSDSRGYMKKWVSSDQLFHLMISEDPSEAFTECFENAGIADITDVPESQLKECPKLKKERKIRRNGSFGGILPYCKPKKYSGDLFRTIQTLKVNPKSLVNKLKKKVFKK